jgi:WD40 repeat protein/MinD-like ATPase involved in chromosome partitioning or flagellar assembly
MGYGRIITFYSYKGGTGRSMALANMAWILASRGKKVLTIDWDLEAPGLHRYFRPFLVDKELVSSPGLLEFLLEYVERAKTPVGKEEKSSPEWFHRYADPQPYAITLRWEFPDSGKIDFIPAGKQNADYGRMVNSFNWDQLYRELGGAAFFETLKTIVRDEYDYVLIDSRTGVSDTSGICTIQMPDTLVLCFTLNNQSVDGVATVAQSVFEKREKAGLKDFTIIPVAARVRQGEIDRREARENYAKSRLSRFVDNRVWSAVSIPDEVYYSFEEVLATFRDTAGRYDTVLASIERLTAEVTSRAVSTLNPPSDDDRRRVLDAFAAVPTLVGESPSAERTVWYRLGTSVGFALVIIAVLAIFIDWYSAAIGERARASAIVGAAQTQLDANPLLSALLLSELSGAHEPQNGLAVARQAASYLLPNLIIATSGSAPAIGRLEYSPDSKWIATAHQDKLVRLWDAATGRALRIFAGHTDAVVSVAFNHDGSLLATASTDNTVRIWEVSTGREMRAIRVDYQSLQTSPKCAAVATKYYFTDKGGHTDPSPAYARFSPDEKVVLVGDQFANVIMYSTGGGTSRTPGACFDIYAEGNRIAGPVFNPDGTWLATARAGGSASLFRIQDWHVVPVKIPATAPLLALSSDPQSLLLGPSSPLAEGQNKSKPTAVIWDVASQRSAQTIPVDGAIHLGSFSPDRSSVALTAADPNTSLLGYLAPVATGQVELLRAKGLGAAISVGFSPGSDHVALGTELGYLVIWKVDSSPLRNNATWPETLQYLRQSTRACLSVENRGKYLGEATQVATQKFNRCEMEPGR